MNSFWLILSTVIIFLAAYILYGRFLATKWGIDPARKTPAHDLYDGVDYVPAKAPVLLGHHFSSIAGAGPIVGPIAAAIFGWVPILLWIIIGSIFFGGVHDMGALFASVRHRGRSLGEVIGSTMGRKGKQLFAVFAWLTLILVVAAFTNIVASTFVSTPEAASASLLFIALAVAFGFFVYRRGASLAVGSVVGVILLFGCIYVGTLFPLTLSKNTWMVILLAYVFIASVTPVWILLQPRDYLNSFLLYAMLIGGFLGALIMKPNLSLAPVTSFNVGGKYMFPLLFVTVACGAVSGFHSLVGSGTTSKQLDNERDIRLVGYGSMLIEGILAVIAIVTAAYLSKERLGELLATGGPINVFADGLGNFMTTLGVPFTTGKSFTALAISAFAMTSLDTATRLARFIMQEMAGEFEERVPVLGKLSNKIGATVVTVVISGYLSFNGWTTIWPLFGSANQLLSALTLLSLAVWLKQTGRAYKVASIPMVFMFAVTLSALLLIIKSNLANPVLLIFAVALFILAIVLIVEAKSAFNRRETEEKEATDRV